MWGGEETRGETTGQSIGGEEPRRKEHDSYQNERRRRGRRGGQHDFYQQCISCHPFMRATAV